MGKSIITDETACLICGNPQTETHHVMFGRGNRNLADKYGLTVPLCVEHHRGNTGVHQNRELDLGLKKLAQAAFEKQIGSREDWMKLFYRSYL